MTDISNYDDSESAAEVLRQHAQGVSTRERASKEAARSEWADKVAAFLDTPMANGLPSDNLICLLASDPLPAVADSAVLAIEGGDAGAAFIEVIERHGVGANPPILATAGELAGRALDGWGWATWTDTHGRLFVGSLLVLWPLGHKPGDDRDPSRVGLPLTPTEMAERL